MVYTPLGLSSHHAGFLCMVSWHLRDQTWVRSSGRFQGPKNLQCDLTMAIVTRGLIARPALGSWRVARGPVGFWEITDHAEAWPCAAGTFQKRPRD